MSMLRHLKMLFSFFLSWPVNPISWGGVALPFGRCHKNKNWNSEQNPPFKWQKRDFFTLKNVKNVHWENQFFFLFIMFLRNLCVALVLNAPSPPTQLWQFSILNNFSRVNRYLYIRQFKHQTLAVKRYAILGLPCSYVISFCVPQFGFPPLALHLNAKL